MNLETNRVELYIQMRKIYAHLPDALVHVHVAFDGFELLYRQLYLPPVPFLGLGLLLG